MPTAHKPAPTPLYSREILAAAVRLAEFPLHPGLEHVGDARSRTCGSTVSLGLTLDAGERIAALGCRVQACAVGQAASAVFVEGARGRSAAELAKARAALPAWLAGEGGPPEWPGIALLDPARGYPARQGAILLAWDAALAALASTPPVR